MSHYHILQRCISEMLANFVFFKPASDVVELIGSTRLVQSLVSGGNWTGSYLYPLSRQVSSAHPRYPGASDYQHSPMVSWPSFVWSYCRKKVLKAHLFCPLYLFYHIPKSHTCNSIRSRNNSKHRRQTVENSDEGRIPNRSSTLKWDVYHGKRFRALIPNMCYASAKPIWEWSWAPLSVCLLRPPSARRVFQSKNGKLKYVGNSSVGQQW